MTTYYIDTEIETAGDGKSWGNAFKTAAAWNSAAEIGDSLMIKGTVTDASITAVAYGSIVGVDRYGKKAELRHGSGVGISAANPVDLKIKNLRIDGCSSHGIEFTGTAGNVQVIGTVLSNNGGSGAVHDDATIASGVVEYLGVEVFKNAVDGLSNRGFSHGRVVGSKVYQMDQTGGGAGDGITGHNDSTWDILYNEIWGCEDGIHLTGAYATTTRTNVIMGNLIHDCTAYGMRTGSNEAAGNRFVFRDNVVRDCKAGVFVSPASGKFVVDSCVFEGNGQATDDAAVATESAAGGTVMVVNSKFIIPDTPAGSVYGVRSTGPDIEVYNCSYVYGTPGGNRFGAYVTATGAATIKNNLYQSGDDAQVYFARARDANLVGIDEVDYNFYKDPGTNDDNWYAGGAVSFATWGGVANKGHGGSVAADASAVQVGANVMTGRILGSEEMAAQGYNRDEDFVASPGSRGYGKGVNLATDFRSAWNQEVRGGGTSEWNAGPTAYLDRTDEVFRRDAGGAYLAGLSNSDIDLFANQSPGNGLTNLRLNSDPVRMDKSKSFRLKRITLTTTHSSVVGVVITRGPLLYGDIVWSGQIPANGGATLNAEIDRSVPGDDVYLSFLNSGGEVSGSVIFDA